MRLVCTCAVSAAALASCGTVGEKLSPEPLTLTGTEAARAQGATTNAQKEIARRLIAKSDTDCENFLIGASVARNTTASVFDVASAALNGVGSVIAPADTARALSAASGFTQSTRKTLNDELLGGYAFGILYRAVHEGRDGLRQELHDEIDAGAFNTWSAESIRDYINGRYQTKCGINYGLSRLGEAESRAEQAEARSRELTQRNRVTQLETLLNQRGVPIPAAPPDQ